MTELIAFPCFVLSYKVRASDTQIIMFWTQIPIHAMRAVTHNHMHIHHTRACTANDAYYSLDYAHAHSTSFHYCYIYPRHWITTNCLICGLLLEAAIQFSFHLFTALYFRTPERLNSAKLARSLSLFRKSLKILIYYQRIWRIS